MKLVFIHGLATDSKNRLFSKLSRTLEGEKIFIDYSDILEQPGWTKKVLSVIREEIPEEEHILIGHSFGALASLYLYNSNTKAIVALSPAIGLNISVRLILTADLLKSGIYRFEGDRITIISKDDFRVFDGLMKDVPRAKVPTLLIVGEEDKVVDKERVRKYFYTMNNRASWFVEVAETGHNFVGREKEISNIIEAFLSSIL